MKFQMTLSDTNTLDVHAPDEAGAREHVAKTEAEIQRRAQAAGVPYTPRTVTAVSILKTDPSA